MLGKIKDVNFWHELQIKMSIWFRVIWKDVMLEKISCVICNVVDCK